MSHFNEQAKEWDSEDKIKMMSVLASKTIDALNLDEKIDIMDFGCGTGLFGLEMTDYAQSLVGIDTSEGMLEVFDKKTKGHPEIKSVLLDLEKQDYPEKFDLIVSSMAFHHLKDPAAMIVKFQSMLKPQGRIAIVDLDKEDGTFHPDNAAMGVQHHGFTKNEIMAWADQAGLALDYQIINDIDKNDKTYQQFLAIMK